MALAPYKINDRRSSNGYSNDALYKAARPWNYNSRQRLQSLNRDSNRNVSASGRRNMTTIGRWLFANCSPLRGAVIEKADYAAASWVPQFYGEDKEWGTLAENWLYEHDKICDVRGWPYTMATYRRNLIIAITRCGDQATLLTSTDSGYPLVQVLGSHRIGSDPSEEIVSGGPFDGSRVCDGVISDEYGRVIGYRVLHGDDFLKFTDYAASDMFLSYLPEYPDQIRGFSAIASALFDWQDITESRDWELLAQKLNASIALIEENETGEADAAQTLVTGPTYDATTGALSTPATEQMEGGTIRYFRANTNSKLQAHRWDRPSGNVMEFENRILRAAFAGMNWSLDFSLDPTKAGGAQMRIVVEKINRAIQSIQDHVLLPAMRRIDGWRIAKAIKLGQLPLNKEWFKWDYQGPARLTADEKYSSDVDLQELSAGASTLSTVTAKRGGYWQDIRSQKEKEADDLLTRAGALAKKHSVTVDLAISLLQQNKLNPNPVPSQDNEPEPQGQP